MFPQFTWRQGEQYRAFPMSPLPGTNAADSCLTLVIGQEPVFSTTYGRLYWTGGLPPVPESKVTVPPPWNIISGQCNAQERLKTTENTQR